MWEKMTKQNVKKSYTFIFVHLDKCTVKTNPAKDFRFLAPLLNRQLNFKLYTQRRTYILQVRCKNNRGKPRNNNASGIQSARTQSKECQVHSYGYTTVVIVVGM